MRKLFLLATLLSFTFMVSAQSEIQVAVIKGKVKNTEIFSRYFNEVLAHNEIGDVVGELKIRTIHNDYGSEYYLLQAQTTDSLVTIATVVFRKKSALYFNRAAIEKGVIICSGCKGDCKVSLDNDLNYYCSKSTSCNSCTKTITLLNQKWTEAHNPIKEFLKHYK